MGVVLQLSNRWRASNIEIPLIKGEISFSGNFGSLTNLLNVGLKVAKR
jgi:hypothetical protein